MNISVVGLGKLGACTAACFAYKGHKVIGIDINEKVVDLINEKKSPHFEPGLDEMLKGCNDRLITSTDYSLGITDSDITFLILPTPSKEDGEFSDEYIKNALLKLSEYLINKDAYHTFVIVSTVSPKTIESSLIPLIEKVSDKKLNKDFGVVYNPEFIALGSVIKNFLNPDMVLIGENSKKDGDIVQDIYRNVCENEPYFARMSIVSAEITKISLNSFVTMKISFANTLGNICEKIPGADVNDVTKALGADKRISPYYLKAGPPYGGPCFPRDNRAFAALASRYGIDAKLAKATDEINDYQVDLIVKKILDNLPRDRKISIIGIAYKEGTTVTEESLSIKILKALFKKGISFSVFDSFGANISESELLGSIVFVNTLKECLNFSTLHILCSRSIDIKKCYMKYSGNRKIKVFDIWRRCINFNLKNVEILY